MVKDSHLSEDIFQEVCIIVIDNLKKGKYIEEGKFIPWVLRIAHNLCIDHIRKVQKSKKVILFENLGAMPFFASPAADNLIIKKQTRNAVRSLIDLLPENQREVIIFRHYSEMTFKEIAALHNCSVNTTLGHMRYGLNNLRRMIRKNKMVL